MAEIDRLMLVYDSVHENHVRLDDHLLAEAKRHAAKTGKTLTAVCEEALREPLSRRTATAKEKPVRLRTFKRSGTRPGVDLDNSASAEKRGLLVPCSQAFPEEICNSNLKLAHCKSSIAFASNTRKVKPCATSMQPGMPNDIPAQASVGGPRS